MAKCSECQKIVATTKDEKRHPQNSSECKDSCWCWTRCWDGGHREADPDPEVHILRRRVRALRLALRVIGPMRERPPKSAEEDIAQRALRADTARARKGGR